MILAVAGCADPGRMAPIMDSPLEQRLGVELPDRIPAAQLELLADQKIDAREIDLAASRWKTCMTEQGFRVGFTAEPSELLDLQFEPTTDEAGLNRAHTECYFGLLAYVNMLWEQQLEESGDL